MYLGRTCIAKYAQLYQQKNELTMNSVLHPHTMLPCPVTRKRRCQLAPVMLFRFVSFLDLLLIR